MKVQEEKDRQKKEEEERLKKEKEDDSAEDKTNGQTPESNDTAGHTDALSQKVQEVQIQGDDDEQEDGMNKRTDGDNKTKENKGQGQNRSGDSTPPDGAAAATGSNIKKASWGKGKGKKGRKGKKKAANPATAGIIPGCEKNNTAEKDKVEVESENVGVEDIEVELSGEKVHIIDDVTDLQAQGDKEKEGTNKEMKEKDNKAEVKKEGSKKGKCPFSGASVSESTTKEGVKNTESEKKGKCPFSGVSSGFGGAAKSFIGQDSIESNDSFDEKVEKGQVLPAGHPPVDLTSFTPVGANTAPKKPMMDLRMFCPKFASGEGEEGDAYDEIGGPVDMDDFIKGFQDFLKKKRDLDKKIHHIESSSEESDG